MKIEISAQKVRERQGFWKRKVARHMGGFFAVPGKYEFQLGERCYYPYWIGKIYTSKQRPLFGPRVHYFYVVCDGISGNYIVLQALPKTQTIEQAEDNLISVGIEQARFEREIVQESITGRINRQFIIGLPETRFLGSKIIYIPVQEVLARERGEKPFSRFFVNVYTGETKRVPEEYMPLLYGALQA